MISSFAAVVRAPWTAATITFADAGIVRIGKNREDWEELSEAEKVENNGALT